MRKEKITEDQRITRLKELAGIKLNETKHNDTFSTINYTRKIGDTTYGVVKEHGSYYIKSTTSELITESTMDYIGGLENKNTYKYNSYADALKNLNMIHFTINESEDYHDSKQVINERLQKDIEPAPAPGEEAPAIAAPSLSAPQQAPAPQAPAAPAPEAPSLEAPAPEGETSVEQPAPEGEVAPEGQDEFGEEGSGEDSIEHYLGKTTAAIRKVPVEEFSEERIKSIMNTIISSLPLDKLSPEDLLKLARRVKRGGRKDDEDGVENSPEQSMPAPEEGGEQLPPAPAPEGEPEELQEKKKYPWDKCEKNAEKEYGSKKTADKVCGAIKAGNVHESWDDDSAEESDKEYIEQKKKKEKETGKKSETGVAAVIKANSKINETVTGKYSIKDDTKINEMISKIEKKDILKEGSTIKYKGIVLESDGKNKLTMNNGKSKYEFLVKNATIQKLNELAEPTKKVLTEAEKKVQELVKKVVSKIK